MNSFFGLEFFWRYVHFFQKYPFVVCVTLIYSFDPILDGVWAAHVAVRIFLALHFVQVFKLTYFNDILSI